MSLNLHICPEEGEKYGPTTLASGWKQKSDGIHQNDKTEKIYLTKLGFMNEIQGYALDLPSVTWSTIIAWTIGVM